ncbi:MFS-type transporter [Lecanosticta acicola]|uniref:MFS-type transporter n=1 Tax=Lecanosticta acicola TaxID=111012 RepID=A0AAI8W0U3_9PEZI|nr:MFS-type transporter [Lecanosticta acicola]
MFAWLFGSDTKAPIFLRIRSSKTFIILTVSSSIFTDIFAYGIVVPVFPFALTSRAGIDPKNIQTWLSIFLAVYGASLLICSPIFGWLGDRMKYRQIPFLIGLLLLGGSTVMLCVGNSIAVFAVGRILQGASAAVVWVVGLALLVDTVGPEEIGIAMGYIGLSMSMAILLAPLLAGVVFANAGYYAVFAMVFGLIIVDIILRFAMIEQKYARKWLSEEPSLEQDEPSVEEQGAGAETDVEAQDIEEKSLKEGRASGQEPETYVELASPKDVARERAVGATIAPNAPTTIQKIVSRLPPVVTLFGSRRLLAAFWASTINSALMTSFDSILPLFTKNTFGWNSTGAGLIFLPIVTSSFLEPFIGKLSDKYGPRWIAMSGFLVAGPFLILLRLVDHDSIGQKVMLCAFLAMIGLGLALALTPLMAEFSYAVEAKAKRRPAGFFGKYGAYAQSYALFNMAWAAGAMIGPLLAGLTSEASGWPTATLILGCVALFTAIPTAIWTGGSIFKERQQKKDKIARFSGTDVETT